jgi:hypothetical protein
VDRCVDVRWDTGLLIAHYGSGLLYTGGRLSTVIAAGTYQKRLVGRTTSIVGSPMVYMPDITANCSDNAQHGC